VRFKHRKHLTMSDPLWLQALVIVALSSVAISFLAYAVSWGLMMAEVVRLRLAQSNPLERTSPALKRYAAWTQIALVAGILALASMAGVWWLGQRFAE